MERRRLLQALVWSALACLAFAIRWRELHGSLIYPDGYDYLLMARGIALHLQPTVQLGTGGMLFSPPLDAAVKPVFPALVALLSLVTPLRTGADVLTVTGGTATVLLAGLVTLRLTGSQLAGLSAGALALVSPALGFWSGFTGPDALAPALALATALLALDERAVASGVMGALCVATRPEWGIGAALLALAALARPRSRSAAGGALIAAAFTLALILGVLRPPLGHHFAIHSPVSARAALSSSAIKALLRDDWPIVVLAVAGLAVAVRDGMRLEAVLLVGTVALLATAYLTKNPGSERYLSQLLPLMCVSAGIAVSALPTRSGVIAGVIAVAALLGLTVAEPGVGANPFSAIAERLQHRHPAAVLTAAPEAYGYLLPNTRIEPIEIGARGLIVLDGAQRAYAPTLSARGRTIASVSPTDGFERPDGTIDYAPARLVHGVVTVRTG
jgi:hypothetical protein